MNVRCVVPVSGGKDSQLCLQMAVRDFGASSVLGLFCDTGFEHPKTYEHIEFMRHYYGVEIRQVNGGSVDEKCVKYGRFPSGAARFCTDELKMRPSRDFYASLLKHNGPFQVWYGMRTGESSTRARKYLGILDAELHAPHELFPGKYPMRLAKGGVFFRLPIVDFSTAEVLSCLGVTANPLYAAGFDRVGCFPCLAAGPRVMAKAFGHDEFGHAQSERVIRISQLINKDPMSPSGQQCSVCLI